MLQCRHKQVFTTSYNFDFKSKRSLWRLENTREKCLSKVRWPTGFPGSEMTTHDKFFFEHLALYLFMLNYAMAKKKEQKKKKNTVLQPWDNSGDN